DHGGFRIAAASGPEDYRIPIGTLVPMGKAVESLDLGRTIVQHDANRDDDELDRYFRARGLRSYAAVPVRAGGRATALVGFSAVRAGAFSDCDFEYVEAAVREAATALYVLYAMGRQRQATERAEDPNEVR